MLVGILVTLLFAFECCIVESCVPEFKGTYDETQDELLAVDWNVDINEQRNRAGREERQTMALNFTQIYDKRLSELKTVYELLFLKNQKKDEIPASCAVCCENF